MSTPSLQASAKRRWVIHMWDGALVVIGFFVTVMATANVPGAQAGDSLTDLGLGVWLLSMLAWATVLFRRRWPWWCFGAGLALTLMGTEYVLLLIGTFHLMTTLRGSRRILVGVATVASITLYVLRDVFGAWGGDVFMLDDGSGVSPAMATVMIALVSLIVTAGSVALSMSSRATSAARLRADAEHHRATSLGDELARQAERQDLAREIHDGLTNRLALLSMMGGNVSRAVERGDPAAAELARTLQSQSREALGDLRGLVQGLRDTAPDAATPRGSMRAIPALIADARAAGTAVSAMVILDGVASAPPSLDAAVHRIAQESLTNAMKHARDQPVSFYLEASPASGVRLRVTNRITTPSRASEPSAAEIPGAGAGLVGIAERTEALGGTAWTGKHAGEFIVDVTLPWSLDEDGVADQATTVAP